MPAARFALGALPPAQFRNPIQGKRQETDRAIVAEVVRLRFLPPKSYDFGYQNWAIPYAATSASAMNFQNCGRFSWMGHDSFGFFCSGGLNRSDQL